MSSDASAAVVTGAARGIGKAIATQFAEDDAYDVVACFDVDDLVEDVATDLTGGKAYTVDVSDQDAVVEAVEAVEAQASIESAVNNAAISHHYWIGDLEPDEWDFVLDVNLKGQYNVARAVGPRMVDREAGTIVNISSIAGTMGSLSGGVHYSASKAGVLGLTRGLAKQLSPHVNVNAVVPGLIDTRSNKPEYGLWTEEGLQTYLDMLPKQRLGKREEVAELVHFLCGSGGGYMTGSVIHVDGGARLVPMKEFLMPE